MLDRDSMGAVSYCDSTEVSLLFNPRPNESVVECLIRRENILKHASANDYLLQHIIIFDDDFEKISHKEKRAHSY